MPRAALPLSYMAGSILLYEEMTSVTILQLALEPVLSLISFGREGREKYLCVLKKFTQRCNILLSDITGWLKILMIHYEAMGCGAFSFSSVTPVSS